MKLKEIMDALRAYSVEAINKNLGKDMILGDMTSYLNQVWTWNYIDNFKLEWETTPGREDTLHVMLQIGSKYYKQMLIFSHLPSTTLSNKAIEDYNRAMRGL